MSVERDGSSVSPAGASGLLLEEEDPDGISEESKIK
jgi:hypothetical protein